MSGQFKVAALTLDFFLSRSNKAPAILKEEFKKDHGAAFEFLGGVLEDVDKNDIKETFLEENISAANRDFITEVLSLQ